MGFTATNEGHSAREPTGDATEHLHEASAVVSAFAPLKLRGSADAASRGKESAQLSSPEGGAEYITSDSPVVLSPLAGTEDRPLGYESLHAHVLFPLSRNAALVMNGDGQRTRHTDAKAEQVARFNATVAADCYRHVIGSRAEVVRMATEPLNLTGTKWAPRVDVGIGIPPGENKPAVWIRGLGKRPVC